MSWLDAAEWPDETNAAVEAKHALLPNEEKVAKALAESCSPHIYLGGFFLSVSRRSPTGAGKPGASLKAMHSGRADIGHDHVEL